MRIPRPLDPVRLIFAAPAISPGEDWKERSLWSWIILARQEGLGIEKTADGGPGFSGTWCGNVRIDGLLYRIHRAPRLRYQTVDAEGHLDWLLHAATYVEPVTTGVEVIDSRHDSVAVLPELRSVAPRRYARVDGRVEPAESDLGI
jgi:hypothetical protein